jgi:hypothetical protein
VRPLPFERPDPDLAREALWLALLTYGLFIEMSDRTVHHGLGPAVLTIFQRHIAT